MVLMRVWNPIDFKGQRSWSQIFTVEKENKNNNNKNKNNKGNAKRGVSPRLKIKPGDLDLLP
jgi:hypothetical protein